MAQPPPPPPHYPPSHMPHMYPSPYYPYSMPMWLPQKNAPPYPYPYPYPTPMTAPPTNARDSAPEGPQPGSFVLCEGRGDDYDERRVTKRPRITPSNLTPEELKLEQARLVEQRKLTEAEREEMTEEMRRRMEETRKRREAEMKELQAQQAVVLMQQKLARILGFVKAEGLTLDRFLLELIASKEQTQSSQVSRMLNNHGTEIVEAIVDRKPKVIEPWMKSKVADMYSADKKKLTKKLRTDQKKALKAAFVHLQQWQVMDDLQHYSPAIWEVLERLRTLESPELSNPAPDPEPTQNGDAPAELTSASNANEASNENEN